jgi:hypothetical protein
MTDAEKEAYEDLTDTTDTYYDKMFNVAIIDYVDGDLYYTKSYYDGSSTVVAGSFSYDMREYFGATEPKFDTAKEVKHSNSTYNTIYKTGVSGEIVVGDGSKYYLLKDGVYDRVVHTSNVKMLAVIDGYMYYYTSSSNDIYKFALNGEETAQKLTSSTPNTTLFIGEIMDGKLFYVNPDYKYVYVTDLSDGEDVMLGKYNKADQDTIDELNKEDK